MYNLNWVKGRQLEKYGKHHFEYNANGIRTSRYFNAEVNGQSQTVRYNYELEGSKVARIVKLRDDAVDYELIPLYDTSDSPIGIIYENTPYWFIKNLQGDIVAIRDEDNYDVVRYNYDAWGNVTVLRDHSECSLSINNPVLYRGYIYDREYALYYLQSRYYDPEIGRFINPDEPEVVSLEYNALSTNLYSYCNNNCIMLSDKSGMFSLNELFKKIVGFLKKLYSIFIDNLKNQIQITKKHIRINVNTIKLVLDLAITLVVSKALKYGIEKIIGFIMKKFIQTRPESFLQFIGKVLNHSATKWFIKVFILMKLNLGYIKSTKDAIKSVAIDTVLSVSTILGKINSIQSACSSLTGLIAFVLDLTDYKWDDYLTVEFA